MTKAETAMKETAARVEEFTTDAQTAMKEQMDKFAKGMEEVTAYGQENVDAFVKTSEIYVKAAEGLNSEVAAYSKKTFEDGVAAAKDLASAKNMTELFEKQTAWAQSSLDGFMQQMTKMNDIFSAAMKDASAPVSERMTKATEVMKAFAI